jgi:hypothetical protein
LADDLLKGSSEIGDYLGVSGDRALRLISRRVVPAFKLGGIWHARRSTLRADIERRERERGES